MAELGLNEQHQSLIMTYGSGRGIFFVTEGHFSGISGLAEETYTAEEVRELVCGLREAVLADVEAELRSCGRAAALLLRQLLAQAERWHLRLAADMSQLHDREQLEQVAALEESGTAHERPPAAGGRLAPLSAGGGSGAAELVTAEVEARRLQAESAALQGQLEEARLLAQVRQQQIIRLNDELDSAREKLAVAAASSQLAGAEDRQEAADPGASAGDRVPELEERVSQLSLDLSGSEAAKADLERRLAGTREELAAAEAKLALAEQELERKFSETTAYSNMKRMLASKNEQLRELRSRLRASGEGGEGGAGAEDEED